ncbi:hypothetical protein D3C87_158630 [compost metagenome]
MAKKRVKFDKIPKSGKLTKIANNPESYLSMPISWQFGLMDFEFEYGWENVIDRIQFSSEIKQQLLLALAESNCSEELYSLLDELKISEYKSMHEFLDKLKHIDKITPSELLCIMGIVHKSFFWTELFPKLREIETKKWHELEKETFGKYAKSKNHQVEVKDLIKEAKNRLVELNLDDHQELYSLRLTGTQRIWGIRLQNYLKLLWFDFNHKICPSLKD